MKVASNNGHFSIRLAIPSLIVQFRGLCQSVNPGHPSLAWPVGAIAVRGRACPRRPREKWPVGALLTAVSKVDEG